MTTKHILVEAQEAILANVPNVWSWILTDEIITQAFLEGNAFILANALSVRQDLSRTGLNPTWKAYDFATMFAQNTFLTLDTLAARFGFLRDDKLREEVFRNAVMSYDLARIKLLFRLTRGLPLRQRFLHDCAQREHVRGHYMFILLLAEGQDINQVNSEGESVLMVCHDSYLKLILAVTATNLDQRDKHGRTALMKRVEQGKDIQEFTRACRK